MLPQTKQAVAALKEAGLKRSQFRIKTPWKQSIQDYGETTIMVLCSYMQLSPCIHKLAESFRVVVTLLDSVPSHVSIETNHVPGLYKLEHGQEEAVKEIVLNSSFEQLQLWEAS